MTTRSKEIFNYAQKTSYGAAADKFGISRESVKRNCRRYKANLKTNNSVELDIDEGIVSKNALLKTIEKNYTTKELQSIANGGGLVNDKPETPKVDFKGDHYKFLFFTDPHIGSVYFEEAYLNAALVECEKEKVDAIMIAGDITEGMSNRPGHIYELNDLGYDAQKDSAVKILSKFKKFKTYMCSGNHDRWFIKNSGANIVKDICKELPNSHYLGHDVGEVVVNGCKIMLWHGEDSSSYATSYRVQKIIESIQGGEKPGVLLCGHTHKQVYLFDRNVHCFSGGCIQKQSAWMRAKRLASHTGFWIIDLTINKGSVLKVNSTWYPFY